MSLLERARRESRSRRSRTAKPAERQTLVDWWAARHRITVPWIHAGDILQQRLRRPLNIVVFTDAWDPQMNGVVRTLKSLREEIEARGHRVRFVTPLDFHTLPLPSYAEIRLAVRPGPRVRGIIDVGDFDAVHIATEGPIGLAARQACLSKGIPFTTAFHTKLPEYMNARTRFPVGWGYGLERLFHYPAASVLVPTVSIRREMEARGFHNAVEWTRGVSLEQFQIRDADLYPDLPRPHWLYVGRVAVEKNIEAFLTLDLPGSKIVVGDGPQLDELFRRFPEVHFVGRKEGKDLADHYASADVFVFPSLTDTFGLVNVEALACGTPVAAYPVAGPRDILEGAKIGMVDKDLRTACLGALDIATPEACRAHATKFSWEACTDIFLDNLAIREERVADLLPGLAATA